MSTKEIFFFKGPLLFESESLCLLYVYLIFIYNSYFHQQPREISNLGGIDALVACLGDVREEVVANAACALTNLAQDDGLRSDAQSRGVVPALIEPLQSR